MNILGIDYGSKQVGVAVSQGEIASGITHFHTKEALERLTHLAKTQNSNLLVIGLPDGAMESHARTFGESLSKKTGIPVVFWDETLSSQSAVDTLLMSGSSPKGRHEKVHQIAAAHILQSYLDSKKNTHS